MDFAKLASMMAASGNANPASGMNINRGAGAASAASSGKTATPAELSAHADHMWKFLDSLAESDPDAYKKFISSQMSEIAAEKKKKSENEAYFTPQPCFVVYTRETAPGTRVVYLNICSSPQIPPAQTKDRKPATGKEPLQDILIPLSVSRIKEDQHQGKQVHTTDIVFHPSIITRSQEDMGFKLFMIELALQHVEEDEHVTLHRGYKFESPNVKYVGVAGGPAQQKTEQELTREKFIEQMKKEREEKIKQMKTQQAQKDIVMPSLAKKQQAAQQFEQESLREIKLRPEESESGSKAPVKKKVLIEDLTPDQGGGEEFRKVEEEKSAEQPPPQKSKKPELLTLSSSTSKSSAAASSGSASTSSASKAIPASSSSSFTSSSSSSSFSSESAYSSKSSTAVDSNEFLSSLASIPVAESASPWPYGSSSASMQSTNSIASINVKPSKVTPIYSMNVVNGQLQLSIQLPAVSSVSEVEVDVSRNQLKLDSSEYSLTLTFPQPIDENASSAKFIKKQSTLKISAPLLI